MVKDYKAKNPRLPPISEPTPAQYRAAKYGIVTQKHPSLVKVTSTDPHKMDWPAKAGADLLDGREYEGHVEPVVDDHLVRHVFEMSMNSSSNENVQRILHEKTKSKFPGIFDPTSPDYTNM